MAINPRSSLYLFLTDKLSVLISEDIIKVVDRWNNQIEKEKTSGASVLPAVHIQIGNDFEGSTGNFALQKGMVYVTCHIDIDVTKIDGIGILDWEIMQAVYLALQGEYPEPNDAFSFTALDRLNEDEDNDYDGRYHGKVIFSTYLDDCTKGADKSDNGIVGSLIGFNETINRVDEI